MILCLFEVSSNLPVDIGYHTHRTGHNRHNQYVLQDISQPHSRPPTAGGEPSGLSTSFSNPDLQHFYPILGPQLEQQPMELDEFVVHICIHGGRHASSYDAS